MRPTVGELLAAARLRLSRAPFEVPGREASLILGRVLGWPESRVYAHPEETVSADAERHFEELLDRRLEGEPVAYLFGEREFFGRTFQVDRRVLIPRPETEHLVEAALETDLPDRPRILDLGTGSGSIAITLALEIPDSRVVATDLSVSALVVAAGNAARHGARVRFLAADLAAALELSSFDLVVSNPPYIDPREAPTLSPEVRDFEPSLALFAASSGEEIIRRILLLGRNLQVGTPLMMEVGHKQIDPLKDAIDPALFSLTEVRRDYAGIQRLVVLNRC